MKNKIMDEITTFCEKECGGRECCVEEECVLYRIEQLVVSKNTNSKTNKRRRKDYEQQRNY